MDLAQGGLQVVIVLDTTGSMQPTIDATRAAVRDAVAAARDSAQGPPDADQLFAQLETMSTDL